LQGGVASRIGPHIFSLEGGGKKAHALANETKQRDTHISYVEAFEEFGVPEDLRAAKKVKRGGNLVPPRQLPTGTNKNPKQPNWRGIERKICLSKEVARGTGKGGLAKDPFFAGCRLR